MHQTKSFIQPSKQLTNLRHSLESKRKSSPAIHPMGINIQNIQRTKKFKTQKINTWTSALNRQYSNKEVRNASRNRGRCLTSLTIRETQMKL
jgi:urease accessory protein UreF